MSDEFDFALDPQAFDPGLIPTESEFGNAPLLPPPAPALPPLDARIFSDDEIKGIATDLGDYGLLESLGKQWGTSEGLQQKVPYYGGLKEMGDAADVFMAYRRLNGDKYEDPKKRTEDARKLIFHLNKSRLDSAREKTLLGTAADVASESVPYGLEFLIALATAGSSVPGTVGVTGARMAAIKGLRSVGTDRLKSLVGETLRKEARTALAARMGVEKFAAREAMAAKNEFAKFSLEKALQGAENEVLFGEAKKRLVTRALPAMAQAAALTPAIMATRAAAGTMRDVTAQASVQENEDGSLTVGQTGEIVPAALTNSLRSYFEVLTEMMGPALSEFGGSVFSKLIPKSTVGAVANYAKKIPGIGSVAAALESPKVGKFLKKGTEFSKGLAQRTQITEPFGEFSEEWANSILNSAFNLDDDGKTPYTERLFESLAFPVAKPKETVAMLLGFSVIPAASFAYGAAQGDITPATRMQNLQLLHEGPMKDKLVVDKPAWDGYLDSVIGAVKDQEYRRWYFNNALAKNMGWDKKYVARGSMPDEINRLIGAFPKEMMSGPEGQKVPTNTSHFLQWFENPPGANTEEEKDAKRRDFLDRVLEFSQKKIILRGLSGKTTDEEAAAFADLTARGVVTPLQSGTDAPLVETIQGGNLMGSGSLRQAFSVPAEEFDKKAAILTPYVFRGATVEQAKTPVVTRKLTIKDFDPEGAFTRQRKTTDEVGADVRAAVEAQMKFRPQVGTTLIPQTLVEANEGEAKKGLGYEGSGLVSRAANWADKGKQVVGYSAATLPRDVVEENVESSWREVGTVRTAGGKTVTSRGFEAARTHLAYSLEKLIANRVQQIRKDTEGRGAPDAVIAYAEEMLNGLGWKRSEDGKWNPLTPDAQAVEVMSKAYTALMGVRESAGHTQSGDRVVKTNINHRIESVVKELLGTNLVSEAEWQRSLQEMSGKEYNAIRAIAQAVVPKQAVATAASRPAVTSKPKSKVEKKAYRSEQRREAISAPPAEEEEDSSQVMSPEELADLDEQLFGGRAEDVVLEEAPEEPPLEEAPPMEKSTLKESDYSPVDKKDPADGVLYRRTKVGGLPAWGAGETGKMYGQVLEAFRSPDAASFNAAVAKLPANVQGLLKDPETVRTLEMNAQGDEALAAEGLAPVATPPLVVEAPPAPPPPKETPAPKSKADISDAAILKDIRFGVDEISFSMTEAQSTFLVAQVAVSHRAAILAAYQNAGDDPNKQLVAVVKTMARYLSKEEGKQAILFARQNPDPNTWTIDLTTLPARDWMKMLPSPRPTSKANEAASEILDKLTGEKKPEAERTDTDADDEAILKGDVTPENQGYSEGVKLNVVLNNPAIKRFIGLLNQVAGNTEKYGEYRLFDAMWDLTETKGRDTILRAASTQEEYRKFLDTPYPPGSNLSMIQQVARATPFELFEMTVRNVQDVVLVRGEHEFVTKGKTFVGATNPRESEAKLSRRFRGAMLTLTRDLDTTKETQKWFSRTKDFLNQIVPESGGGKVDWSKVTAEDRQRFLEIMGIHAVRITGIPRGLWESIDRRTRADFFAGIWHSMRFAFGLGKSGSNVWDKLTGKSRDKLDLDDWRDEFMGRLLLGFDKGGPGVSKKASRLGEIVRLMNTQGGPGFIMRTPGGERVNARMLKSPYVHRLLLSGPIDGRTYTAADMVQFTGRRDYKNRAYVNTDKMSYEELREVQERYFNLDKDAATYRTFLTPLGDKDLMLGVPMTKYPTVDAALKAYKEKVWDVAWWDSRDDKQVAKFILPVEELREWAIKNPKEALFGVNQAVNLGILFRHVGGRYTDYKDAMDFLKRASQLGSRGIGPLLGVKGGIGPNINMLVVNDPVSFYTDAGKEKEKYDGMYFYLPEFANKLRASYTAGLDSYVSGIPFSKSLISGIMDEATRVLIKGNMHVIDSTKTAPELKALYELVNRENFIRKGMGEEPIDMIVFKSSAKILDKDRYFPDSNKKLLDSAVAADGSIRTTLNPTQANSKLVVMSVPSETLLETTNLAQPVYPKRQAMPAQLMTDFRMLKVFPQVQALFNKMVSAQLYAKQDALSDLSTLVEKTRDPGVYALMKAGVDPHFPTVRGTVQRALSSFYRKLAQPVVQKSLSQLIANVTATPVNDYTIMRSDGQEIGYSEYVGLTDEEKGKSQVIFGELVANLGDGRRYDTEVPFEEGLTDQQMKEKVAKDLKKEKDHYWDLFPVEGTVVGDEMDPRLLRIKEKNGKKVLVIPGELVLVNRVPGTGYESHTFLRLSRKVDEKGETNLAILPTGVQLKAGADFDGDMLHILALYRDRKNPPLLDDSPYGLANQILMTFAKGMSEGKMIPQYEREIDTDAFDTAFMEAKALEKPLRLNDPAAYTTLLRRTRGSAIGIAARNRVAFTWAQAAKIPMAAAFRLPKLGTSISRTVEQMNTVYKDNESVIDMALDNMTNIIVDDLKLGKASYLGLNEELVSMTMFAVMNNPALSYEGEDGLDGVRRFVKELVAEVYSSPLLQDYLLELDKTKRSNYPKSEVSIAYRATAAEPWKFTKDSRDLLSIFLPMKKAGENPWKDPSIYHRNTGKKKVFIELLKRAQDKKEYAESDIYDLAAWVSGAQGMYTVSAMSDLYRRPPSDSAEMQRAADLLFNGMADEASGKANLVTFSYPSFDLSTRIHDPQVVPSLSVLTDMYEAFYKADLQYRPSFQTARAMLAWKRKTTIVGDEEGDSEVETSAPLLNKAGAPIQDDYRRILMSDEAVLGKIEQGFYTLALAERTSLTIKELEAESKRLLDEERKKDPTNTAIDALFFDRETGIELDPSLSEVVNDEELLATLREDFDKLPANLRLYVSQLAIAKYGLSSSTFQGSPFAILGPNTQKSIYRLVTAAQQSNEDLFAVSSFARDWAAKEFDPAALKKEKAWPKFPEGFVVDPTYITRGITRMDDLVKREQEITSKQAEVITPTAISEAAEDSLINDVLGTEKGKDKDPNLTMSMIEISDYLTAVSTYMNPVVAAHRELVRSANYVSKNLRRDLFVTRAWEQKWKADKYEESEAMMGAVTAMIEAGYGKKAVVYTTPDAVSGTLEVFNGSRVAYEYDEKTGKSKMKRWPDGSVMYEADPTKTDKVKDILRRYEALRKKDSTLPSVGELITEVDKFYETRMQEQNLAVHGFVDNQDWIRGKMYYVLHKFAKRRDPTKPTKEAAEELIFKWEAKAKGKASLTEAEKEMVRQKKGFEDRRTELLRSMTEQYNEAQAAHNRLRDSLEEESGRAKIRIYNTYEDAMRHTGMVPVTWNSAQLARIWQASVANAARNKRVLTTMGTLTDVRGFPIVILTRSGGVGPNADSALSRNAWDQAAANLSSFVNRYAGVTLPQLRNLYPWQRIDEWMKIPLGSKGKEMPVEKWLQDQGYKVVQMPSGSNLGTAYVFNGTPEWLLQHVIGKGFAGIRNPYLRGLAQSIRVFNSLTKQLGLSLSFFHHFALIEAYGASYGLSRDNPLLTPYHWYKAAQKLKNVYTNLKDYPDNPEVVNWMRDGLTFSIERPDFDTSILNGLLDKAEDRWGGVNGVKAGVKNLRRVLHWNEKFLWEQMQPAMKLDVATRLLAHARQSPRYADIIASGGERGLRRDIAKAVNNMFGGQNWSEYVWATPFARDMMQALIFAPDWCCDGTTRAITKTGYKYHSELKVGDEILGFDPETQEMRWMPLKDLYSRDDYSGEMVTIKNYNRKIRVTPDHKCYTVHDKTRKSGKVLAKDLNTHHLIPRVGTFKTPDKTTVRDWLVRVASWMVTDGTLAHTAWRTNAAGVRTRSTVGRICQNKELGIQDLESLGLSSYTEPASSGSHGKYENNRPTKRYYVPTKVIRELETLGVRDNYLSWDFLSKLTRPQLELLYKTLMLGDGTGQNRFCGEEREVFYMTLLQTMLGKPSTFYQQEAHCWRTRTISSRYISCAGDSLGRESYEGTIWCPSVETGYWVAEREGLIFTTGNTISALNSAMIPEAFSNITGVDMPLLMHQETQFKTDYMLRRYWPAFVLLTLVAVPVALQAMIYQLFGDPDKDDKRWMWENEEDRKTHVDMTPLTRALGMEFGTNKQTRAFVRWGKSGYEILGWFTEFWSALKGKSSVAVKTVLEQFFDQNSAGWDMPWRQKGREQKFSDWWTVDESFAKSRLGALSRQWMPMTVLNWIDDRPPSFFAPSTLGKSSFLAARQIAEVMNVYADDGIMAKLKGQPHKVRKLEQLVDEILDASERNGWPRKEVLEYGMKLARDKYYKQLFEIINDNPSNPDIKKASEVAEKLLRLQSTRERMWISVTTRARKKNLKVTPQQRSALSLAITEARMQGGR